MNTPLSFARTESPPPYERWWRCLFNESEDAQLVYANDGTVLEANRAAVRLLGLAGRETLPNLHQMLTSNAAARVAALLQQQVGSQVTLPAVALMVEGQISLLADLQITPLGQSFSLVTLRDATRRWRMESHVQRLVTAMDATPDVVFLTDVEFRLVFVNPSFLRDTGYSIEETLGRPADFLRAAGQEEAWQLCREQVRQGKEWQGEFVNVRHDGSSYLAAVSIAPIFDRKGVFLGCVSFERDITQTRRQQQEWQRESEFARSLVQSLEAALYAVDGQFRLLHFNDAWQRLPAGHGGLRWERPPRLGDLLLEFVPDSVRQAELRRLFHEVLRAGAPREVRGSSPDGRFWQGRIAPWTRNGHVEGLLYLVSDQTDLHLAYDQLLQGQPREIIGALAGGVAGQFTPLLRSLRHAAEHPQTATECDSPTPAAPSLQTALSQAAELVHQLLALEQSPAAGEILDFNQILHEAAHLHRREAPAPIECRVTPAAVPPLVRISRARALQMLRPLWTNAREAMPNGGTLTLANSVVRLDPARIRRASPASASDWLRCTVRDSGCGIPPEHLPRLFDAFFTTKTRGQGGGLGLTLTRHIITHAGGWIEIESQPGQGTAVHLLLPLLSAEQLAALSSGAPARRHKNARVLVVDANPLTRKAAVDTLESTGYFVDTAAHAAEALKLLQTSAVDALYVDAPASGSDTARLFAHLQTSQAPWRCVVALSHRPAPGECPGRQCSGMVILEKPFPLETAAQEITRLLAPPNNRPAPHS